MICSMVRRVLLCVSLWAVTGMPGGAAETESDGTLVRNIVDQEAESRAFDTLYVEAAWQITIGDKVEYVHCTTARDSIGRVRYRLERGPGQWSKTAKVETWEEWTSNGEVVVQITELDVTPAPNRPAPDKRPLTANIQDARPVPMYDLAAGGKIGANLEAAIGRGEVIEVRRERSGFIGLTWTAPRGPERREAVVDVTGKYPKVVELTRTKPSGELISQETFTYAPEPLEFVIPSSYVVEWPRFPKDPTLLLSHGPITPDDVVPLRQAGTLISVRVNDPNDFPEETFQISLPTGTYVWDKRFKVDYVVGAEAAVDDKLGELATRALAEQSESPQGSPLRDLSAQLMRGPSGATEPGSRPALTRWNPGWTFLSLLVLIGGSVVWRRLRERYPARSP